MDTKLKNRHKLGIFLVVLTIVLSSAAALGLYPYMEQRAMEAQSRYEGYTSEQDASNQAVRVMNSVYAIWQENVQREQGSMMTPSQVFLPDLEEKLATAKASEPGNTVVISDDEEAVALEFADSQEQWELQQLQQFMDERGRLWKNDFRAYQTHMAYCLTDEKDQELAASANVADAVRRENSENIVICLAFDSIGALNVETWSADKEMEPAAAGLASALESYRYYDPVENGYDADYLYQGVRFSGPKNVFYRFWLDDDLFEPAPGGTWQQIEGYRRSGVVTTVALCLMLFVSVVALILPAFSSLHLGQEKIFRAPFILVLIVGIFGVCGVAEGTMPSVVVADMMSGQFTAELIRAGFIPVVAGALAWFLNGCIWAIGLGLTYWGVTCLRSIFTLGLWRYIKERTLIGWFFCWLKRCWDHLARELETVDLQDGSTKLIGKVVLANFICLTLFCCLWFFGIGALIVYSVLLFIVIRKYWTKMQGKYKLLLDGFKQVADGNLNVEIPENLGIFEPFKEQLAMIQKGFSKAVEEEVKSQRMKTELVTNVSHDLKTPLTAIITYINLLKKEDITEEEREAYIDVLEQKSMRLKMLIEDLFDISKATSRNITLNPVDVDIVSLMKQVNLELSDRVENCGVDFRFRMPEEKVVVRLDSQKTYRIFENLLVNIAKYAMPGTRAYIDIVKEEHEVTVTMRNVSAEEIHISPEELTERFVRGDEARNTEGSGLGLAIAKSFVEVQGGTFRVETEADLFRVTICFPV